MQEESANQAETERHPLLIDVVLETVAKLIPSSGIPSCRLVCKKWNYFLIGRFRNEVTVKLTEWKCLEKFVELLRNSPDIPYKRFHICRISLNNPFLENVFEICGPLMQHLTLELTKDEVDICQLREMLLLRAPNLVELSFDTHDGLPEEVTNHPKLFPAWCPSVELRLEKISLRFSSRKKFHVNFLKDLFQNSPLKEISFRRLADGDSETAVALTALMETGPWSTLTSLSLGQIENKSLCKLTSLKEIGVRLKTFSFEHLTADVNSETLQGFLLSQAENFEELVLNEYLGSDHLMVHFPVMANLRKLSITAFEKSQILPHKPIAYVNMFPNLWTLAVYGWQNMIPWDIVFSEEDNVLPLENLRHLQPPYRMNNLHYWNRLVKLFPNITSLDVTSPSNDVLTELWTSWLNLQILDLFLDWNNTNVDAAVTGISLANCEHLRRTRSYKEAGNLNLRESPSICNLKALRTFVCEIYEPWRDGEPEAEDPTCLLTDISGYGALFHMYHLQQIFVARSEVSSACVREIIKELPIYSSVDIRGPSRQKLLC